MFHREPSYVFHQIIYDLEGNPVSYGGKTLNWYGKQLKQVTAADGSYTQYDYDANGLRTQKRQYKADGTTDYTVDYVWSDGKIAVQSLTYPLTMTIQGNTVTMDIKIDSKFIYCDDDATPSAIMLENDEYLLVRNLQGDVVAVVNAANGETVVEFSYDPWGNITRKYSETYTDGTTEEELKLLDLVMSALCPVTYRGYNYDFTTGLYYLQSRYYNPEWGRFLNTDDTSIMLTKIDDAFSANIYLYCNNNPVNNVDYNGRKPLLKNADKGLIVFTLCLVQMNSIESGKFFRYEQYEPVGVALDIDQYGLYFFRITFYDKRNHIYFVTRALVGSNDDWTDYILTEANRYVDWGDFALRFYTLGNGKIEHSYKDTQEMQSQGMASLAFISTCAAGYLIGIGVLKVVQKSDDKNGAGDRFLSSSAPNGFAAFAPVSAFNLKLTAIAFMKAKLTQKAVSL